MNGLYQVSNLGNIISYKFSKTRYMSVNDNSNGYKFVTLCKNGKRKNHYIHKLVAKAFISNNNNYKEINHKDNNKKNNCVNNLEWCTRNYNVKYSYDKGYHIPPKQMLGKFGKNHPMSKPIKQYDINGNFIKEYESASLASKDTGICYMSIKKCRCGKQKTAGGYVWIGA